MGAIATLLTTPRNAPFINSLLKLHFHFHYGNTYTAMMSYTIDMEQNIVLCTVWVHKTK